MISPPRPMRRQSGRIRTAFVERIRGLVVLLFCLSIPVAAHAEADTDTSQSAIEARIAHYAKVYGIPFALLRKVVKTESTFNPAARNGPYWGLMQIRHDTARGLGYRGPASGLLDGETNLIYGGAYLANAYIVAGGNEKQAHRLYKSGYYYEAKRKRLLAKLIRVPMDEAPIMVASNVAPKSATAESSADKAGVDKNDALRQAVDTEDTDKSKPEIAKVIVAKAEIIMPTPRARPAQPTRTVALADAGKSRPMGLLYATALDPKAEGAALLAEQTIARPELALASAEAGFASRATAAAIATPRPSPRHSGATQFPTAIRLAATYGGTLSDAPACCQLPAATPILAMPLPRVRPSSPALRNNH